MIACKQVHEVIEIHYRKVEFQIQPISDQIFTRLEGGNRYCIERYQDQDAYHRKEGKEDDFDCSFFFILILLLKHAAKGQLCQVDHHSNQEQHNTHRSRISKIVLFNSLAVQIPDNGKAYILRGIIAVP